MDTTIIPESLIPLIPFLQAYLEPLKLWFSRYIYDKLLRHATGHDLVKLYALLDFAPLERDCANYHHQSGAGRKPQHTVPKLVRAFFIKYYFDLSLRQLEFQIRFNLLFRWFVGYHLFEEVANFRTLHNFEKYLYNNQPRNFFDVVLKQIDKSLPAERERSQIGDTFALQADAALESSIKRLRHTADRLLLALARHDYEAYQQVTTVLNMAQFFGSEDESLAYFLSPEDWHTRLQNTVQGVLACLALVKPYRTSLPQVEKWATYLEKIMADELLIDQDDGGCVTAVKMLPKKERGSYRICSATDPDATIRNHGPDKLDFGYNISVATTTNFVREIRADTGSQPDPVAIPDLLTAQIEYHDHCPEKLLYDQIAGSGKTAAKVDEVTNSRTRLVAKPMPYGKRSERFGPRDFTLSENGNCLTCPAERITSRKYRHPAAGYTFRFAAPECAGCQLLSQCRGQDEPPTTKRDVFISDHTLDYQRLVAYSHTPEFKAEMKQLRPQVERVISGLVLHNGARRARFRGLHKVDYQVKMCAMAYNVKRWLTLLAEQASGKQRKKRRRWGTLVPARCLA